MIIQKDINKLLRTTKTKGHSCSFCFNKRRTKCGYENNFITIMKQ